MVQSSRNKLGTDSLHALRHCDEGVVAKFTN